MTGHDRRLQHTKRSNNELSIPIEKKEGARRTLTWWMDPQIKQAFMQFCKKEGLNACEAVEHALLGFMQHYDPKRTTLNLQITQVVRPNKQQLAKVKEEIERKINPKQRQKTLVNTFVYECPSCGKIIKWGNAKEPPRCYECGVFGKLVVDLRTGPLEPPPKKRR